MIGTLNAVPVHGVIFNFRYGRLVDPSQGLVFGALGEPCKVSRDGYVRVKPRRNQNGCLYAHRLIWETVNGPIPSGHYIDHKNGRKADNRIDNLEPVLPRENSLRAIRAGLAKTGEQRRDSKLTAVQVCEIRRTGATISCGEWARELGVDRATVSSARHRRSWRHIVCHRDGTASVRPSCRMSTQRRPRRKRDSATGVGE